MKEEWKVIPWGKHNYEVSNKGRVRNVITGNTLKPYPNHKGYPSVLLTNGAKCKRTVCVHWVETEAFLGPRPVGLQTNHKDGVKVNNNIDNLEYVTPSANMRHAHDVIKIKKARGIDVGNAKLTDEQVSKIRELRRQNVHARRIACIFGIHPSTVYNIAYNQRRSDPTIIYEGKGSCKLTPEDVARAKTLRETQKLSYHKIAKLLNVSYPTARSAILGLSWKRN